MADSSALMLVNESDTILNYIYNSFNTEAEFGLLPSQLQHIYQDLRDVKLNLSQIEASMEYVCACPALCDREELLDVLKEMDRRFYLAQDLQWEFAMLDRQRKGAITQADAQFLFKMVYGEFFSKYKFENLMKLRKVTDSDVSFEEIEVQLCNIPTHEWVDELFHLEEKENEERQFLHKEKERQNREAEEAKRHEEEMKQQMEEEDKKFRQMLEKKKTEKIENEKRDRQNEDKEKQRKEKEAEEMQRAESERIENEKLALEKAEQERLAAEKAEQERLASEKAEQELIEASKKEEQERLASEKLEMKRLASEKAEQDSIEAEKAEQARILAEKEDNERIEAEKSDNERIEAEKAEQERLAAEATEQERLDAEKAAEQERLDAEKAEEERVANETAEQEKQEVEKSQEELQAMEQKKTERAVENWGKAKQVASEKIRTDRVKKLHTMKSKSDSEEASRQSHNAEEALAAERAAEEELAKLELELASASTEEAKEKAEKASRKVKKAALKHKEKRLRSTLKAAVKLRSKPRIDAGVEEAKEALPDIPTLQPDIEAAEKVSDSIKCGNDLEDAMAKRDLSGIEDSISTIKKKGIEQDHAQKLLLADKLVNKLRRLEKLKKDILALDQRTISEIRSYKKPLPAIQDVMIATYVILGYKEKQLKDWKFILGLLGRTGKEGLKRQCTTLDATTINQAAASLADKRYLSKHDLETVTDISAGAATFFVWSSAMVEENRSWHEDSEFREKLEAKKRQEEEEAKRLEEEKKNKKARAPAASSRPRKKSDGPTPAANARQRKKSDGTAASDKQNKDLQKPADSSSRSKSRSPATRRKKNQNK